MSIKMRRTRHAAVSAGLMTALSLVVTLEGMPVRALATTPADAPSTVSASSEAPSSQESSAPATASAPTAQSKAAAPTEKKTTTTSQQTTTPQQQTTTSQQKSAPSSQTQQVDKTEKSSQTEKAAEPSQTQQTTGASEAGAAPQDSPAKTTSTTPQDSGQKADPASTEATAPTTTQQDSRPQSVSIGVRAVDEQGKDVEGATISVSAGTERKSPNAAGAYDLNQGETVAVTADAPNYTHVEQTFVINGSPLSIMMRRSGQASTPRVTTETNGADQAQTAADVDSQNQAEVDRMAREFDASYGVINLLAFAPRYGSGVSVTGAIMQRLTGGSTTGLTVSVATSSDASVVTRNGTVGGIPASKVMPYETAGCSECSFTFSLGGARATTRVHTVQVGYWSTDADGERASYEMQKDVVLPRSFRTETEVPLPQPSRLPDGATFTWRLVSPDSAFTLATDADGAAQTLVAHSQDHATSATLEAAMVPTRTAGYDFYFYPVRSFTLRMGANATSATVNDPLHPVRRRQPRSIRVVTPTLVPAVVPTVVPTPTPSPSDDDTPIPSPADPDDVTDTTTTDTMSTAAAVTSGASTVASARSALALGAGTSSTTSASDASSDAMSATESAGDVAPSADDASGPTVNEQGLLGALQSTVVTSASGLQSDMGVSTPGAPAAPMVPFAGIAMGIACIAGAVASHARKGTKMKARK